MQIDINENELIIRETPGCLWFFGLFFVSIGGVFIYGGLIGFSNYYDQTFWITLFIGLIGVIIGIWIIYKAPVTRVIINRLNNLVSVIQYGWFGRRHKTYDFDEIEQFYLIEEKDNENRSIWSLAMKMIDDEIIKISSLPSHDELFKQRFVFLANEFMDKQLLPSELIFEFPDESNEEMS